MLHTEARVETARSSRYLEQLCQHVQKIASASPTMQARVDWSADRGEISLGDARCVLQAEPGALTLRADASDEEGLRRLEERVAERLEQIGRRDGLTVTWRETRGDAHE